MKTYARIVDGHAVDITTTDPATLYHPDLASTFIVVPDGTATGAGFANGAWTAPLPPAPILPPPLPLLTPMSLYLAFTPAERIAIKKSVDPMVAEFWETYQMSVQLGTPTDPNLVSVREALAYLSAPASPGPGAGILASPDRVQQILAGIAQ